MTTVTNVNQIAGVAAPESPFQAAEADLADKNTFLRLLTTQLSNQDPTNPMDNEQFLSQLAQFSSLEQLMGVQATMQAVYTGIQALNNASMANLLGTRVTAAADSVKLEALPEGETVHPDRELGWVAGENLSDARLEIRDESGKLVRTVELGSVDAEGSYTWDGTGADGKAVPAGTYTFKVTGTNSVGDRVTADTRITGIVDGMDYATGTPQPFVDGVAVSLGDLVTLRTGDAG